MASVKKIVETLSRIREGESCTAKDWDNKVLPHTIRGLLKKYELGKTYNPAVCVNQDMELADRFFQAGLELAEVLGVFCTDTETILRFSKGELLQALKEAPEELELGFGIDRVLLKARRPEDTTKPLYCASLSIQIDEEIYVPLVEGLIASKSIDILQGPSIDTVYGYPTFSGTPFETAAGIQEARLREEAVWRAGRPGISQMGMSSSVTEYGFMCGFAAAYHPNNPMMGIALQPAELKTNYVNFNKALTTAAFGGILRSGCPSMIGGYSGPPEGSVIANIASDIIQFALFGSDVSGSAIYDVRLNTSCSRPGLWAMSMSLQATSRNSHMIVDKIINQSAGPCTEDILYTNAGGLIATCVSGMEYTIGPRSAGGTMRNYLSPLEAIFSADVIKAAAGMSLDKGLELTEYCLSKYEATVENQPKGKSFYDCYDMKTLKPTQEWADIEKRVREDLRNRGLNI
ncbi:MAG: monomethylamine:corrinoid methyltransferase [Bacillota bacterium]